MTFLPFVLPIVGIDRRLLLWLVVVAVGVLVARAVDRRLLRRLPWMVQRRLDRAVLDGSTLADRVGVMTGWAAVHDTLRRGRVRRSAERFARRAEHVQAAIVMVDVVVDRALISHRRCVDVESERSASTAVLSRRAAMVFNLAVVLPGDVAVTSSAMLSRETDLSLVAATILALAVSGGLFLAGKLLGDQIDRRPVQRTRLSISLLSVVALTAAVVSFRRHDHLRWTLLALAPAISSLGSALLSSTSDIDLNAARVDWEQARRRLEKRLIRLARQARRAAAARARLHVHITAGVTARDNLSRAGTEAGGVALATTSPDAAAVLARLGVTLPPDPIEAAQHLHERIRLQLAAVNDRPNLAARFTRRHAA